MQSYWKGIKVIVSFSLGISILGAIMLTVMGLQTNTTWYVSTNGDDNSDCQTLLTACETIETAVTKATHNDTIIIASGVYTENNTIDKSLILQGNGRENTILDGNASGSVLTITEGITVTISSLAITNGQAPNGGGIFNDGSLALTDCRINNNSAIGRDGDNGELASGGGIYNNGKLLLNGCLIYGNKAQGGNGAEEGPIGTGSGGGAQGGSIYSISTLILHNTIISDNFAVGGGGLNPGSSRGGGIYSSGTVTIENSQVISNAANGGGGMYSSPYIAGYSTIEIITSTLKNNTANDGVGGAIDHGGSNTLHYSLLLDHSTISNNRADRGGGIYTSGASAGSTNLVTITHSTLSNNLASSNGGAIYTRNQIGGIKTTTIINSTISENSAEDTAGAIFATTTSQSSHLVQILNSSIISNSASTASGFYSSAGGSGSSTITFKNTIVSNDLSSSNCVNDYGGMTTSNGYNLDSENSCNFTMPGDMTNTDPLVMPLADNGGETFTHALSSNSPAIDAGDNSTCQSAPVSSIDQRDIMRPQDGNNDSVAVCDIGSYELDVIDYLLYLPLIMR